MFEVQNTRRRLIENHTRAMGRSENASAWTPTEVKCLAKAYGSLLESGTSNNLEVSPGEVSGMSKTERNAAIEAAQLQLFAAKSLGDDGVALLKAATQRLVKLGYFHLPSASEENTESEASSPPRPSPRTPLTRLALAN